MTTKAYNRCVHAYADRLYGFILKHSRRRDVAQDIVQDCFETLWNKRSEVRMETAKAWLFKVAYNRWIDLKRKRERNRVLLDGEMETKERNIERFVARDAAEQMLSVLTDTQRTLVLLREHEGYSYDEISKITELSLSQVKVYLYRARKRLSATAKSMKEEES